MIDFILRGEPVSDEILDEPYTVGETQMTVRDACVIGAILLTTKVTALQEIGEPLTSENTYVVLK